MSRWTYLKLDFAPRSRKSPMASMVLLLIASVLFLAATTYAGRAFYRNVRQAQALTAADGLRRITSPPPLPRHSDPQDIARAQFVRQTSRSLMAPWPDLLAALESAPSNVALLSMEPSASQRSISLTAEAADPTDMLKYLQVLQGDARLADVTLVSHQVQLQSPGNPLRFQLRASWGDAP